MGASSWPIRAMWWRGRACFVFARAGSHKVRTSYVWLEGGSVHADRLASSPKQVCGFACLKEAVFSAAHPQEFCS
jgi:hypothetical protein